MTVEVKDYLGRRRLSLTKLKPFLKREHTAEEGERVNALMAEGQTLKATGIQLADIDKAAKEMVAANEDKAAPVGSNKFMDWGEFVDAAARASSGRKGIVTAEPPPWWGVVLNLGVWFVVQVLFSPTAGVN